MVLKLALVGCGNICRNHVKAILGLNDPSIVVSTLVDINIKGIETIKQLLPQNEPPCQVYQSLEEANSSGDYDAAVIMVPHDLHVQFATECLSAGKHVLLEKPAATTVQGCVQLIELAKSTDRVFMVAESAVFWPEAVRAMELIKDGTIGEPFYAQSNYWESLGEDDFSGGFVPEWIFDPDRAGGGVVMDGGIHWIRLLRLFMGDVKTIVGMVSCPWKPLKVESLAHALLQFENGKTGVLYCHYNEVPMENIPFFQIFGPKGEITIHGTFDGGLTVHTKDKVTTEYHGGYWNAFGPQMARFVSAVKKGERLTEADPSSVWEAAKDVFVAKTLYKSVESGHWEQVIKSE